MTLVQPFRVSLFDLTYLLLPKLKFVSIPSRTVGIPMQANYLEFQCPLQILTKLYGGSGAIRTHSAARQEIYSLPRLSNFGAGPQTMVELMRLKLTTP